MNHLAHFLLTSLLLPSLRLSAVKKPDGGFPRVVVISSGAHRLNAIRFDDPNFEIRPEEYSELFYLVVRGEICGGRLIYLIAIAI